MLDSVLWGGGKCRHAARVRAAKGARKDATSQMSDPRWQYRPDGTGQYVPSAQEVTAADARIAPRLRLRWIVYEDQCGNYACLDPDFAKPMGMDESQPRPDTFYGLAYDAEVYQALEAVLWVAENRVRSTPELRELIARGRDLRRAASMRYSAIARDARAS